MAELRDKCDICHGDSGAVPGLENIVEGLTVCDYCLCRIMSGTLEGDELLTWELHRNGNT